MDHHEIMEKIPAQSLDRLPKEILREIFCHIPPHLKSLTNVALVSRTFRDIIQPLMYRSIQVHTTLPNGSKSVPKLMDVFKANPGLGRFVRELEWFGYEDKELPSPDELLSQLPNLQRVYLQLPTFYAPRFCTRDLVLPHTSRIETLRFDFALQINEEEVETLHRQEPCQIVARHLHIPSLRRLAIIFFSTNITNYDKIFLPSLYGTSPITSLQVLYNLGEGCLDPLIAILKTAKALRHVVLEFQGLFTTTQTYAANELDDLRNMLPATIQRHSNTMVELAICDQTSGFDRHIVGLNIFDKLKRLAIPLQWIVNTSSSSKIGLLPPDLEELQVQTCYLEERSGIRRRLRSIMRQLLIHLKQEPQHLKVIVWWDRYSKPAYMTDVEHEIYLPKAYAWLPQLVAETDKLGIRFDFSSSPCFSETPLGRNIWESAL